MLSYTKLPRLSKKKGKRKPTLPLPKFSLQFAFSWSVYFSNRTESYPSQIEFAGPHGITENQATYLHCGGEARAKKRARPPATCRKASTGKTGADTGPEGCGSPARFPSPCLGDSSTKTTIMTVHVNKIMQAAPSQRRIISIIEASNQLLFHSQKFEKKISMRRLPQGTVRDLILLTMWVLSPTNVVVIFVQCIDCSGWAFGVMGCCPQISPSVYII